MPEIKVNAGNLKLSDEYVCWIDIMGTRNIMSESIQKATNFILKFHSCVIDAIKEEDNLHRYPLMDGVFITSPNAETMKKIINKIFNNVALLFLEEDQNGHRFIVKGSLSYGSIAHGDHVNNEICNVIAADEKYKNTLMLGMPMIQAINTEKVAPPFGVYIHESARKYNLLQGKYYSWTSLQNSGVNKELLKKKIFDYFDWCEQYIEYQEMDINKIRLYKQLTSEYFSNRMKEDQV